MYKRQAGRAALKNTVVEPAGDSCLCVVCADSGIFSVVNREAVFAELTRAVQEKYGKTIDFKARLDETGKPESTIYVSEDELKLSLIHI